MNSLLLLLGTLAAVSGFSIPLRQDPETLCIGQENFLRIARVDSCSFYYQCYAGRAYLMECPEGTWFNEEEQVCDRSDPPARCALVEPDPEPEPEPQPEEPEEETTEGPETEGETEEQGPETEEQGPETEEQGPETEGPETEEQETETEEQGPGTEEQESGTEEPEQEVEEESEGGDEEESEDIVTPEGEIEEETENGDAAPEGDENDFENEEVMPDGDENESESDDVTPEGEDNDANDEENEEEEGTIARLIRLLTRERVQEQIEVEEIQETEDIRVQILGRSRKPLSLQQETELPEEELPKDYEEIVPLSHKEKKLTDEGNEGKINFFNKLFRFVA